ncbi:hypothetical protein DT037_02620 [Pseudomonas fulva]|uniref:hypothetical protein n=1 Tax=Pseudomonas fulva TaxID=47880 RepID=UPI0015F3BD66|nr:hypothetical protein [Pseudomonas fulva]MBA5705970.1 hypothetical protein [Pseudomonas fulva]
MSMLEFIGELGRAEKIHRKPHIPRDKAYNAIASYCSDINYDDIQLLIDETVFGNAKVGLIITSNEIYGKENFCDPFRYSLSKVSSLFVKKNLMTSTLYINERQVIKFTQPSGSALTQLFDKIEQYLQQVKRTAKLEPIITPATLPADQTAEILPRPELASQKATSVAKETELSSLNARPLEPSEAIEVVGSEELVTEHQASTAPVDEGKSSSRFRRWPKDNLITSIQTDKHVSAVFNFIGDVLSDNKSGKSAALRREVQGFLAKTVLRLRKEYIDRNHVIGLMNDVATMELLIYSIAYLRIELSHRRLDTRLVSYALSEGVQAFLSLDNSTGSRNLLAKLLHLAESMGKNIDQITFAFYLRILMSNMKGELADDELEMRQLRTLASFDKESSMQEALERIIQEFLEATVAEIGDISSNRQISYDARRCADSIIDTF